MVIGIGNKPDFPQTIALNPLIQRITILVNNNPFLGGIIIKIDLILFHKRVRLSNLDGHRRKNIG